MFNPGDYVKVVIDHEIVSFGKIIKQYSSYQYNVERLFFENTFITPIVCIDYLFKLTDDEIIKLNKLITFQ